MQAFLTIAVRAARKAGDFVIRESDKIRSIHSKTKNDYITDVDAEAKAIIIDTLSYSYPQHHLLGEDNSEKTDGDYQWLIAGIDGYHNFTHRIPHWAISIACIYKGKTAVAAIYDPVREEFFSAVRGQGAQLNGHRIRVAANIDLEKSIIATAFPFQNKTKLTEYSNIFNKLFPHCADMRRTGSTALDLAYVAAGRLGGFWEVSSNQLNSTAGALLVTEAGGMIADLKGDPNYEKSGTFLASNSKSFKNMLTIMNQKD